MKGSRVCGCPFYIADYVNSLMDVDLVAHLELILE